MLYMTDKIMKPIEFFQSIKGIPNSLTILRISLIPIFIIAFYWPSEWRYFVSTVIFGIGALTDWLDGYLARKLRQISSTGAFLDPVADKLIVVVALVLLVELYGSYLITIPAAIIVCREITVSALREWMAEFGKRYKVAVSNLGKIKTGMQITAILLLLLQPPILLEFTIMLGHMFLYLAVFFAVWSMWLYLKVAWQEIGK